MLVTPASDIKKLLWVIDRGALDIYVKFARLAPSISKLATEYKLIFEDSFQVRIANE